MKTDLPERAKRAGELANEHAESGDQHGLLRSRWSRRCIAKGSSECGCLAACAAARSSIRSARSGHRELAYGDPSAGWVLMAAALAIGTGAAYLGDSAVEELFAASVPVIAGQGTRPGTAVREKGGFRLSGSWSFASGIKHGTHIHTLGVIEGPASRGSSCCPLSKRR